MRFIESPDDAQWLLVWNLLTLVHLPLPRLKLRMQTGSGTIKQAVTTCAATLMQEFQKQPEGMPLTSAVWDLHNPTAPEPLLEPISQLTCAACMQGCSPPYKDLQCCVGPIDCFGCHCFSITILYLFGSAPQQSHAGFAGASITTSETQICWALGSTTANLQCSTCARALHLQTSAPSNTATGACMQCSQLRPKLSQFRMPVQWLGCMVLPPQLRMCTTSGLNVPFNFCVQGPHL